MKKFTDILAKIIFWSRWLQAPLYIGLIIAQAVYVYNFSEELYHLVSSATHLNDSQIMLIVIGLIDVVMIANLLIMVIIGGYETFVSHLYLMGHPDRPEWLHHLDAGTMKIKLAMSLIGISSIHLLRTFMEIGEISNRIIQWQVVIHLTFVVSTVLMAYTNRLISKEKEHHK